MESRERKYVERNIPVKEMFPKESRERANHEKRIPEKGNLDEEKLKKTPE